VKAGSIMPVGPKLLYATEKSWDNLQIHIYEGSDGEFTLYEDENDNYNYEKGFYSTITFIWDETKKTLTIEDREGSFPGMIDERKFNIIRVGKNKGTGMDTDETPDKKVIYKGRKLVVKM
jgi:alpha-D-xyloside xylohydrolase